MLSFVEIGLLVPEKIFDGFLPYILAWRSYWSCDMDYFYTHWFPLPIDRCFILALIRQAVSQEVFEIADGRQTDRCWSMGIRKAHLVSRMAQVS